MIAFANHYTNLCDWQVVESIIANPLVRKVNFTGSTRVGSIVGALCGKYIKPSVLELGGAAVFITLEDADLELAAKNAVYGSFFHSGQICMSTNNILGEELLRAWSRFSYLIPTPLNFLSRQRFHSTSVDCRRVHPSPSARDAQRAGRAELQYGG